eukprot:CAMPEP_0206261180 /NCGR_PEP_ID=MMETSP0047_2-20121206/27508_1 /ASSEMBLY_ACC=CAM_ASM_000192 /TAXON_ID=195065 /ORGANISM="Chroomonas mesostigmatica_cf, Strain CCMP1168" /LENGTH=61 /DNA_ID=CAMNT_0053688359 /DNA_START=148 /DNA_END=329 /DNA_ORIENTATION=+
MCPPAVAGAAGLRVAQGADVHSSSPSRLPSPSPCNTSASSCKEWRDSDLLPGKAGGALAVL